MLMNLLGTVEFPQNNEELSRVDVSIVKETRELDNFFAASIHARFPFFFASTQ